MNLDIPAALQGIALTLRERIAPAVEDSFASETARLAGMLLTLNANWVDDAVAIRVAENAAIRELFVDAHGECADSKLAGALATAASSVDPGLRISELDRENSRLRALTQRLHEWTDVRGGNAGTALSQRIWRLLSQFEADRAPRG